MLRVDIDNGKYTVVQNERGALSALRYGEPWRDLVGDNLIGAMAYEIDDLREQLRIARERLAEFEPDTHETEASPA